MKITLSIKLEEADQILLGRLYLFYMTRLMTKTGFIPVKTEHSILMLLFRSTPGCLVTAV